VGDDGERRRADIGKSIDPRELALLPSEYLHGIAPSGVGTTVVVEPQREPRCCEQVREVPVRHAGVETVVAT